MCCFFFTIICSNETTNFYCLQGVLYTILVLNFRSRATTAAMAGNTVEAALSKKYSKFPIYNTKSRGKRDTTRNIPRMYLVSPLHFVLHFGKSITFGTVRGGQRPSRKYPHKRKWQRSSFSSALLCVLGA